MLKIWNKSEKKSCKLKENLHEEKSFSVAVK